MFFLCVIRLMKGNGHCYCQVDDFCEICEKLHPRIFPLLQYLPSANCCCNMNGACAIPHTSTSTDTGSCMISIKVGKPMNQYDMLTIVSTQWHLICIQLNKIALIVFIEFSLGYGMSFFGPVQICRYGNTHLIVNPGLSLPRVDRFQGQDQGQGQTTQG